jgi:hypothetical protein
LHDAVAAALHVAERPIRRAKGGSVSAADTRVSEGVDFHHGLLKSSGSGRTDTLPLNVPNGSYVLPADIVSGLGQGNTMAGGKILDRIFADMGAPAVHDGSKVPIIAAGGEYLIHPDVVRHIGGGDLKKGHEFLDKYVKDVRTRTHKTLKTLPGPAK